MLHRHSSGENVAPLRVLELRFGKVSNAVPEMELGNMKRLAVRGETHPTKVLMSSTSKPATKEARERKETILSSMFRCLDILEVKD